MTFEEKIQKLRSFLIEIVKPSIAEYLSRHNYDEFVNKWQRNYCRQTAILTGAMLEEILLQSESGYKEIQVWDGHFMDVMNNEQVQYNHAWIYCIHENPKYNLLVDIGRNHKEQLVWFTDVNEYPSEHPDYRNMKLLNADRIDILTFLAEKEYFTGKAGITILRELKNYINRQILISVKDGGPSKKRLQKPQKKASQEVDLGATTPWLVASESDVAMYN